MTASGRCDFMTAKSHKSLFFKCFRRRNLDRKALARVNFSFIWSHLMKTDE